MNTDPSGATGDGDAMTNEERVEAIMRGVETAQRDYAALPPGEAMDETARLRARIAELEAEVAALKRDIPEPINDWRNSIDPIEDPEEYARMLAREKK